MTCSAEGVSLRRSTYSLLITIAAAAICGRILAVVRVYEPSIHRADPGRTAATILAPLGAAHPLAAVLPLTAAWQRWQDLDPDDHPRTWPRIRPEPMPTFASNDRSRWATVRALVDEGTFIIGHRDIPDPDDPRKYRDFGIVFEDGWETVDKVKRPTTSSRHDFLSSKPPLLTTLVAGEYWLLKQVFGWSITRNRWLVVRTILITINVLPFVLYLGLLARLAERLGRTDWGRLFVIAAGCFGTFLTTFAVTLNNHGPAAYLALFALYPGLAIWAGEDRRPLLFVAAGFCAALTACVELPAAAFGALLVGLLLWKEPRRTLLYFAPAAAVPVAAFFLTNYLAVGMWRPAYSEFGGPWYDYPGSHWNPPAGQPHRGIDWAGEQESRAAYIFHFLLGHHGVFSLSPIWLLAVVGMGAGLVRWLRRGRDPLAIVQMLTLALTLIVLAFYLSRPERMRNYSGWSSGPRWLFWLTPFWLVSMIPVADWLGQRRWGRGLALLLLALSVVSVSFPAWNPWRHPWIYQLLETLEGMRY